MNVDCDYIGYEVLWENSLLDVVDNFIHRVIVDTYENVKQTSLGQMASETYFFFFSINFVCCKMCFRFRHTQLHVERPSE